MKLNPNSTQPPISEELTDYDLVQRKRPWEHPWNAHMKAWDAEKELEKRFKKPNPPTKQQIEQAKFKDKTYNWNGR